MVQRYMPCSQHGSIIVTSQLSDMRDVTTCSILIGGISSQEEALDLLIHYLRNKAVDRDEGKAVINVIGSLPIAIAHAAGVINQTCCSLPDFAKSFKERSDPTTVWLGDKPLTISQYERSFAAVFDWALATLDPPVRGILECLAFLDPKGIPEDMIFAPQRPEILEFLYTSQGPGPLKVKKQLISRHLVESQAADPESISNGSAPQATSPIYPALLVHRSVQQMLLFKLDQNPGTRELRFRQTFDLLRMAVPKQSPYRAPINHLWPVYEKYVPSVRSLYHNIINPATPFKPFLELVELLSDIGNYFWERNITNGSMEMLQTAENICTEVLDPDDPHPVLSGLLVVIASFELNAGPDSRASC
ncbi:hypothetical protein B0T26DRAFT_521671 [Lasiosphaeria miniovina]|uniref:Uncharacterized protein n=1 Tax=Lasiosphaeria miniovina TaxID=1954250 RepID=A0AA39ZV21_9PEZI|nr:uncharacterized protein B0T26DRAFT_521671 [Lasiosphaeria miniovina]KAK0704050.1 hypothetical protein B0T26DRAFT_521671 [Lasiosphaeria miniovina]